MSATECLDLENKAIADNMDLILGQSHRRSTLIYLIYILLMIISVITIWTFKHRRIQYMHESGLSVLYGLIVGIVLRFGINAPQPTFETCGLHMNTTSCGWRLPPEKVLVDFPMGIGNNNLTLSYAFERAFEPSSSISFRHIFTFNPEIIFDLMLPPIIFAAGYSMKRRHFFKNIGAILVYAFFGTFFSALCIGIVCYLFTRFTHLSSSLFFSDCLFFGSIISATDPITVLAIFNDLNIDVDLYALVFGESVLNDALAIALSQSVEQYGSMTSGNFDTVALFTTIGNFFLMFGVSLLIGIGVGVMTAFLTKFTYIRKHPLLESALFVLMSYSTFLLAETVGFTGIVAVLFCGITQAHYTFNNLSKDSKAFTKRLLELMSFFLEIFLFVYLGVTTFTFEHHYWDAYFIVLALIACIMARALNIYPLSALINFCRGHRRGCSPICFCCPSCRANDTDPDAFAATAGGYQVFENETGQSGSLEQAGRQPTGDQPTGDQPTGDQLTGGQPTGCRRSNCITSNMQHMLMFSGLRGAMAFSLAIRNTSSETRQMFFSTTIVIVMVTVLLCGGLVSSMIKLLKIRIEKSTIEENASTSGNGVTRSEDDYGLINRYWSRFDKLFGSSERFSLPPITSSELPSVLPLTSWVSVSPVFFSYMKPLLTHSRPPLTESLPRCCFGLAKLLTSESQRLGSPEDSMDPTDNSEELRREAPKSFHFGLNTARYIASDDLNSMTGMTHEKQELCSGALNSTTLTVEPESTPLPAASLSVGTIAYQ